MWGDLKEAAAKQAKRGRAEKARGKVCGTVVGGAKVGTDNGRWPEKEQRLDVGTCRPFRKLGLYLGLMGSLGSVVARTWWPSKVFVEWMAESIHYPRPPPSGLPAI